MSTHERTLRSVKGKGNICITTPFHSYRRAAVDGAMRPPARSAALAGSGFEGTWNVKDTNGKPFEIVLSSDGAAKANLGEGMTGVWEEERNSAVITWTTGWTTKITEEGGP